MAGIDITPTQDGGVLKEVLTPGEGDDSPPNGSIVKAHYHGTLEDGTVFDSSVDRGEPFEFTLGQGHVIKAWDLGISTMKKGEKARLTCKADYAYGKAGSGPKIPGGATLIFDITLLSWQEEDLTPNKDGGVLRAVLEKGEGYASPGEFCLCKVHLKGIYEGRVFEDKELSFNLEEGGEVGVARGVQLALSKMKKGEKARLTLSPHYGWPEGNTTLGIPPNATVKYEVTLLEFEKEKEAWDMDACDKLAEAVLLKNKATEYFQKGNYTIAAKLYAKAASYLDSTQGEGFSEAEEVDRKKTLLAIRLNLGLVHLKLNEPYEAKAECDKALEIDPDNVKGLFRRGQAYLLVVEPESAKADFEHVVKLEPNNSAAIAQVNACKQKIKELRAKEKQIYSNMFDKFARKDKEDIYHYGWWDDSHKQPIITETEPEEKEDIAERKREKKKQLEHLQRLAKEKKKEAERKAKELAAKKDNNAEREGDKNANAEAEQKEEQLESEGIHAGPNDLREKGEGGAGETAGRDVRDAGGMGQGGEGGPRVDQLREGESRCSTP